MYIVIDRARTQEYEPPYDYHDKGGYRSVERTEVREFKSKEEIESFLSRITTSNLISRRIFSAQELVIKTTLAVDLLPKH